MRHKPSYTGLGSHSCSNQHPP